MNARADFANMSVERAEFLHDLPQRREPTDAELAQAKEELRDEILAGKTVSGFDLNACFDCELNSEGYTGTVHDLSMLVLNTYDAGTAGTALGLQHIAEQIVEKWLPEHAIAERASQNANPEDC